MFPTLAALVVYLSFVKASKAASHSSTDGVANNVLTYSSVKRSQSLRAVRAEGKKKKEKTHQNERLASGGNVGTTTLSTSLANNICISDATTLTYQLENAHDSQDFSLCSGTLKITNEIHITANTVGIQCAGHSGSCVITREDNNSTWLGLSNSADGGRILDVSGNGLTVHGIQFWNGVGNGNGGALRVYGRGFAPVIISECIFMGNSASGSGGAVRVENHGCLVNVESTKFTKNTAGVDGGALSLVSDPSMCKIACPYSVSMSNFDGNVALGGNGGAVSSDFAVCAGDSFSMTNDASGECNEIAVTVSNHTTCFTLHDK